MPSFLKIVKGRIARKDCGAGSRATRSCNHGKLELKDAADSNFYKSGGGLLPQNADARKQEGHSTTLQECAGEGNLHGLKRLLNLGAAVDGVDGEGNTALHCAAACGLPDVMRVLLDRGANASRRNRDGDTPLHVATANDRTDLIVMLVASGADINAQARTRHQGSGWTPLHEAASGGHLQAARLLLHLGADADRRSREGETALHKAARAGNLELVELLLLVGADAGARDTWGQEPLHCTDNEKIVLLLRARKAQQAWQAAQRQADPGTAPRRSAGKCGPASTDHTASRHEPAWDLAEQREQYEVRWALASSQGPENREMSFDDIPWPGSSNAGLLQVLLHGTHGPAERKRRLRSELLRWHPDKFQAVFGRHLKPEDEGRIMARVKGVAQAINLAC